MEVIAKIGLSSAAVKILKDAGPARESMTTDQNHRPQHSVREMLRTKEQRAKPSEAQVFFQSMIRDAAMFARIWTKAPKIRDIPDRRKEVFLATICELCPELSTWKKEVWAKLKAALQNRIKYLRDIEMDMALSAAERAKRYRERKKMNQESREQYLQMERERQGKRYIPIAERTQRDQRKIRRTWKKNQKKLRACRRVFSNQLDHDTPPATPEPGPARQNNQRRLQSKRAKAYRDLLHLKYKLKQETTKVERYRKRYMREKARNKHLLNSPSAKTAKQLRGIKKVPAGVRRTLQFHNVLIAQLRQKYQTTSQVYKKQMVYRIVCGSILRKYHMMETARRILRFFPKKRIIIPTDINGLSRKRRSDAVSEADKISISTFFERDDNSRMMPGKKDTITTHKEKKQKRLLCDNMKNLHSKFLYENPEIKISYVPFCSLRPFWVVAPKLNDRNTCLCKRHDNIQLMSDKLHREKAFTTCDLSELYKNLVCDTTSQECMYGLCTVCADKRLPALIADLVKKEVTYQQWVTRQEERSKWTTQGEEKIHVKVTVKDTITCRISDLYDKFEEELKPRFTTHAFNIGHQYRSLKQLRESLQPEDVVLHIDFSENYSCKSHSEIQSVHFGASHNQATLHTGVAYTSVETIPFCTISQSTRHDPSAIWAHVSPILRELKQSKNLSRVHFISDGPTTQYRNKKNFFFASVIPFELGYETVTWNFLEAGHGKGAADGIGGTLKRMSDRLVSEGKDIPDAETLYETLVTESSIRLSLISEGEIHQMDRRIPDNLRYVPSTMKLHQLIFSVKESGFVWHRILSCFCRGTDSLCACFGLSKTQIQTATTSNVSDNTDSPAVKTNPEHFQAFVQPVTPQDDLLGKWCVVKYDGIPYPGAIVDYDEDAIEVNSMSKIGENRFFWPMREDRIWYEYDKVITLIPEPSSVGSRHVQVDRDYWKAICKHLNI